RRPTRAQRRHQPPLPHLVVLSSLLLDRVERPASTYQAKRPAPIAGCGGPHPPLMIGCRDARSAAIGNRPVRCPISAELRPIFAVPAPERPMAGTPSNGGASNPA